MTAGRESFVLPGLLLTVTLLGGLRVADTVRLVSPSLISLVLGLLLLGTLTRAGVLAPERLMSNRRTRLENVSGFVVLLCLFAASAQVFNLLTPETGILHALFGAFFLVQLLTTLAGVRDRPSLLRSLAVLFGAVFVLRFILLESLYAPGSGLLARLMTTLVEGVTLGALGYSAHAPATGYAGFVTLVLFMTALVLLPAADVRGGSRLPVRAPGREMAWPQDRAAGESSGIQPSATNCTAT